MKRIIIFLLVLSAIAGIIGWLQKDEIKATGTIGKEVTNFKRA